MQDSPRDQFIQCSKVDGKAFDSALAGLDVSYAFPGHDDFLQLPDGTDGVSPHDGYAAWQAQVRQSPAEDPVVLTVFLDGCLEVAEFTSPWEDGPTGFRSDEHRLIFSPFYAEGLAEVAMGSLEFTEAITHATKAAMRRRAARYEACDLCGDRQPAEQLEQGACEDCWSTWLEPTEEG